MKTRLVLMCALCFVVVVAGLAQGAKTRLSLMTYGDANQTYFWNLIKAGFERDNPDYELAYEIVPAADYIQKLQVRYAAGAAPDVFLTYAQYKAQFAEGGMLLDVTNRINKSNIVDFNKFYPIIKSNISYNGRIWGTPWGFNSTLWVANLDLLEQNGLKFPGYNWTVDDLRVYARKIARPEQKIFGTINPIASEGGSAIQWLLNWAGHAWIDASQRKVLVNSPESVAMINYWRELDVDLQVTPTAKNPRKGGIYLGTGDIAFWQGWSTETQNIVTLQKNNMQPVRWRFTTYPQAPRGQQHFAQGHLWSIPANNARPDEAWKLLEWLGSEAADYIWSSSQRTPPTMAISKHWDAYNQLLSPDQRAEAFNFIAGILYSQGYANNFEYWPTFGDMSTVMLAQMGKIFSGSTPAQSAMEQAAGQMQMILDNYWQKKK